MRNGHEEITALLETAAEKVLLGEGGTPTEAECLHYKDSGLLKLLNDAKTDRLESFAGIKFLLKQGAGYDLEINKKGSYRNITALHEAAARGFWPLVKVFVERGADVTLKDYKQRTALDFAKQFNNKKMVQFLEEAARKAASQKQAQAQAEAGHPGGGTPEQQAGTPLPEERVAAEMERAAKAEARVAAAERRAEAAEQKLAAAERAEPAKVMEQAAGAAGRPGMSTLFLVVKGKAQDQADQKKAELNQLPESELSGPRL